MKYPKFILILILGWLLFGNRVVARQVVQWELYQIELESDTLYPWWTFPVEAHCIHQQTNTVYILDGFWDGERNWLIRFTPPLSGIWIIQTCSKDKKLNGYLDTLKVEKPTEFQIKQNPNYNGYLKISKNRKYFEYANGTPFLLLGDTNWAINTSRCGLGKEQDGPFFTYLTDRKAKGFSAILMSFMRGFGDTSTDSGGQKNEGGFPFIQNNPEQLNQKYFYFLDLRIKAIWENGFVIAVNPTWFGKRNCFFNLDWAKKISAYLMVRYGATNLIWSLTGEYQYTFRDCDWMSNHISEIGGVVQAHNAYGHPVSIHPSGRTDWPFPHGEQSSGAYRHKSWLDHIWLQTGHSNDRMCNIVARSLENYSSLPAKPVFLSEAFYERKSETDFAYLIRWQVWNAFLCGALGGYGYGAVGVWNFFDPEDPDGVTGKEVEGTIHWKNALHLKGSTQVQYLGKLFKKYSWWELEPSWDAVMVDRNINKLPTSEDIRWIAAAKIQNNIYFLYLARGIQEKNIEVWIADDQKYKGKWYNPREGNEISVELFSRSGQKLIIPGRPNSTEDWVLILEKMQ